MKRTWQREPGAGSKLFLDTATHTGASAFTTSPAIPPFIIPNVQSKQRAARQPMGK